VLRRGLHVKLLRVLAPGLGRSLGAVTLLGISRGIRLALDLELRKFPADLPDVADHHDVQVGHGGAVLARDHLGIPVDRVEVEG
jgi:hypothetical protein